MLETDWIYIYRGLQLGKKSYHKQQQDAIHQTTQTSLLYIRRILTIGELFVKVNVGCMEKKKYHHSPILNLFSVF